MISLTTHDIHLLSSTILMEARNQPWNGKIAVGYVILNRHAKPGWWSRERDTVPDDTIAAVCVDAWQFSGYNAGDPNLRYAMIIPPTHPEYLEAQRAALTVLLGAEPDPTLGSCHYHVIGMKSPPEWSIDVSPVRVIGDHAFYNNIE